MINFTIGIEGSNPLLLHNGRLADPLDPAAKALKRLTGKKRKTDEDYIEMGRVEHLGALYLDPDIGPYMPSANINRALLDAARMLKLGKQVERGLFINTDINPLQYKGPRDADGLWADQNFVHRVTVVNGRNRVTRVRPMFRDWRTEAEGTIDTDQLNFEQLEQIAERAGMYVGLGDWRPRFGRFTATIRATA